MLVELFDLRSTPEGDENWAESGRWIKYEEDVEGVDKHWGRPHVAFLSYHSLMQLRQCFSNGVLLFDMEAPDMATIIAKLTSTMVTDHGVDTETADNFLNTLKVDRFRKDSSRRFSRRRSSATSYGHRGSNRGAPPLGSVYSNQAGPNENDPDGERKISMTRRQSTAEGMEKQTNGIHEIHGGATGVNYATRDAVEPELCQVYAGVMPSLSTIRFFMVRLVEPIHMPDLRSSYMPLRFLFLVAGPPMPDVDYHELGRAVGTLMADQTFKKLAFTATTREQLVKGIDHFLDFSVIIPPGEIDTHELLTADDAKKALQNRRQLKDAALDLAAPKQKKSIAVDEEKGKPQLPEGPRPSRVDHVTDSLRRTGRPFGGTIEDIKYRLPYYWRDWRDALNFKTVSATLFMFFANFASAVAFAEVMEDKTDGYMGATEMLMSHAICGVVWGLISCQPLCIQAAVGPFLVLEASLYSLCKTQGLHFLAFRWWTGLWTFIMSVLCALVEAPFLMRYLTRFTEDIFTGLIAFIFIWEAGKYIYREISLHPLHALAVYCGFYQETVGNMTHTIYVNETFTENDLPRDSTNWTLSNAAGQHISAEELKNQPNTALLSFILVIFTFILAFKLKRLGTSPYFGRTIRKTLSDFGVPLSVLIVILIYQLFFKDTHIRHVDALPYFSLTNPNIRNWIVNPMGTAANPLPVWAIFAAIIPAIFVTILDYLEVEIIELLLSRPERGLRRPHGFHWDLIVCGGMTWVCSIFGMPWMCPGAVQSTSHANALVVYKRTAPGEAPKLDYVVEQRVSTMLVGILHGAAAFAGVVLVLIPVPVLFGLFLLLGVMGLIGIQFVHRLELLFIPQKYFPDFPYCQNVSMWRMHLYTFVQLLCFAVLWAVNMVKTIAMAFPFILLLICLFRMFVVPRFFKDEELQALDGKPKPKPAPVVNNDDNDNHVHNEISKTIGIKM